MDGWMDGKTDGHKCCIDGKCTLLAFLKSIYETGESSSQAPVVELERTLVLSLWRYSAKAEQKLVRIHFGKHHQRLFTKVDSKIEANVCSAYALYLHNESTSVHSIHESKVGYSLLASLLRA